MRMDVGLQQRQRLEQRQIMAPQMIQSLQILLLPRLELLQMIRQELLENPTLELLDEVQDEPKEETREEDPIQEAPANDEGRTEPDDPPGTVEMLEEQSGDFPRLSRSAIEDLSERRHEMLQSIPAKTTSLQDHLFWQFKLMELPQNVLDIAENIIYNIDDNGLLMAPLEEIVAALNDRLVQTATEYVSQLRAAVQGAKTGKAVRQEALRRMDESDPDARLRRAVVDALDDSLELKSPVAEAIAPIQINMEQAQSILRIIQKLDPPGSGARDTKECLLLQLAEDDPDAVLKRFLIENYIDDIKADRITKITKATGWPEDETTRLVEAIRQLNPVPGMAFSGAAAPQIYPDVIIESNDGKFEVRIDRDRERIPHLTVRADYRQLLKDPAQTEDVKNYIRRKMESAKRLIGSIEQWKSTLYRVATEIVKVQRDFFEHGVSHLKPLRMQQVADTLHIHVSTVSRAVAGKYMQTTRGIFPMKIFFSGATETSAPGEGQSRVSVMSIMKQIVENEPGDKPLSDGDIVKKLKEQGLTVARRTVTKYRIALNISSSRDRKKPPAR
jgi:RNA polymerase sigma-54 factor